MLLLFENGSTYEDFSPEEMQKQICIIACNNMARQKRITSLHLT